MVDFSTIKSFVCTKVEILPCCRCELHLFFPILLTIVSQKVSIWRRLCRMLPHIYNKNGTHLTVSMQTSHQCWFLVKTVRCWKRKCDMTGSCTSDLRSGPWCLTYTVTWSHFYGWLASLGVYFMASSQLFYSVVKIMTFVNPGPMSGFKYCCNYGEGTIGYCKTVNNNMAIFQTPF